MNDEAVYRTAPATPGLLITLTHLQDHSIRLTHLQDHIMSSLQAFIEEHESELGTARRDAEVMVQVRLYV